VSNAKPIDAMMMISQCVTVSSVAGFGSFDIV
jgi:hypothetical protein